MFITLAFLLMLIAVFSLLAPGKFGTVNNLSLLAQNVAILTVVSVGTTFVIATAGIDLSIPSAIILGEVFTVKALQMIPVDDRMAVAITSDETNIVVIVVPLVAALFAGLLIGSHQRDTRGLPSHRALHRHPGHARGRPGCGPAADERRQRRHLRARTSWRPATWSSASPTSS